LGDCSNIEPLKGGWGEQNCGWVHGCRETNESSVLDSYPPLGVDSTDACLSLTVPRGNGNTYMPISKGFLLYFASVSVSILLEISIANGAIGW